LSATTFEAIPSPANHREAATAPELWHQKAYLARVVTAGAGGLRDEGILPLTHALDGMDADMVAMTVESDGQGGLYPVAYVRRAGALAEHALPADPLLDFEGDGHRAALSAAVADLVGAAGAR